MLPPHEISHTITLQKRGKIHLLIVKWNSDVQILGKASNIVIVNDGIDIIRESGKDHDIRILINVMSNQLVKTL